MATASLQRPRPADSERQVLAVEAAARGLRAAFPAAVPAFRGLSVPTTPSFPELDPDKQGGTRQSGSRVPGWLEQQSRARRARAVLGGGAARRAGTRLLPPVPSRSQAVSSQAALPPVCSQHLRAPGTSGARDASPEKGRGARTTAGAAPASGRSLRQTLLGCPEPGATSPPLVIS